MTRTASARTTRLLVASTVVFGTLTIALALYLGRNLERIQRMDAQLLTKHDLQEQLFASHDAKESLYPHTVPEIGYILNPYLKESSWHAAAGETYPISDQGLRGPALAAKREGVLRVVLVGDSVVFGWKLSESDKIASRMQALAASAARPEDAELEVITVAVPGWNTRNQRSFLEHHLDRLDPDVIVWSLLRNDVHDCDGAVPPGVLAGWHSSHKTGEAQYRVQNTALMDIDLPTIVERWDRNLGAIDGFQSKYDVPVILLWWRPGDERYFFESMARRSNFDLPRIVVPGAYRDDERWPVSRNDEHPSAWGTNLLALGILGKLTELELIPSFEPQGDEARVLEVFSREEKKESSERELGEYLASKYAALPQEYSGDDRGSEGILYGIEEGRMLRSGILVLRNSGGQATLRMTLDVSPAADRIPMKLVLSVRNTEQRRTESEFDLKAGGNELDVPLPAGRTDILEISWEFDFSFCDDPSSCYSSTLISAGLTP